MYEDHKIMPLHIMLPKTGTMGKLNRCIFRLKKDIRLFGLNSVPT